MLGGVPVEIPARMEDEFEPRLEDAGAITPRTKAIFIGYPNNPTGAVASRETPLAVANLAEKHDLLVMVRCKFMTAWFMTASMSVLPPARNGAAHYPHGRFF